MDKLKLLIPLGALLALLSVQLAAGMPARDELEEYDYDYEADYPEYTDEPDVGRAQSGYTCSDARMCKFVSCPSKCCVIVRGNVPKCYNKLTRKLDCSMPPRKKRSGVKKLLDRPEYISSKPTRRPTHPGMLRGGSVCASNGETYDSVEALTYDACKRDLPISILFDQPCPKPRN